MTYQFHWAQCHWSKAIIWIFAVVSMLVIIPGCSEEQPLVLPDASLSGKITFKGKPVPHALIIVQSEQRAATGFADAFGTYQVNHVDAGPVKIGVNTDAGRGHMRGAEMAAGQTDDKSAKPSFIDVPKKYFDPTNSGLTFTVSDPKGNNSHDIELK